MSAQNRDEQPSWDEVMQNEAVSRVTQYAPPNDAEPHDEDDDARLRENLEQQGPWLGSLFAAVIEEDNHV